VKFSVVIPLYNKAKEIKNTINSVLNQTYKADEIIVVNDGSTDKSAEIVKENFGNKVKIFNQVNSGVSAARNRGVKEAKNEHICFIDGDDLWEREFLEEIKELVERYPHALFFSTAHKMIDEDGNIFYNKIPFQDNYTGLIRDFLKVFKNNYGIINSSSVCIKKSSYLFFSEGEKKGEDICLWIELSLKGNLAFSSKPLSIYKLDASNRSNVIHKEINIPCQLKWIYKNQEKLTKDIVSFVHKNIFITVYGGFALSKNYDSISAVIELMKKNNDKFYLLLYPAYLIPVRLLNLIKIIRRSM